MPAGQPDARRLSYVIEALLGPVGLRPVFGAQVAGEEAVRLSAPPEGKTLRIELEKLRTAFAALSGQREAGLPRDHLGRACGSASAGEATRPFLSEWAWELAGSMGQLGLGRLPSPRKLTVYLTHDVDRVCPLEPMGMMGKAARAALGLCRGTVRPVRELARWVAQSPAFLGTYERVMRMERDAGAVATYFFLSGPYSLRRYGSRVGRSGRLRRLLAMAGAHGHRVGLHGCAYSLRRRDYARQREALERLAGAEVTWHRNHYLVWDAAESPAALAEGGIRVDSSCAFHDANGFRAGLAWPYELWDLRADAPSGVVEIPLIYMDAVEGLADEGLWERLRRRLEALEGLGAEVAVLFHLDNFVGRQDVLSGYRDLLGWLVGRGAVLNGSPAVGGGGGG